MKIIGRKREIEILEHIYKSDNPEFLAIYGRRRVGKTHLINEFFGKCGFYFEVTGSKGGSKSAQLKNFTEEMSDRFYRGRQCEVPTSWGDALTMLRRATEALESREKIILFFDELPWLSSPNSGFLSALEHCWNRYLSRDPRIILIACGSAAAWMIRKIINNRGGLYRRLTQQMRLEPFTLAETKAFLVDQGVYLDDKQLVDLYMVLGGIPKYLSYVRPGRSSAQVIEELCFQRQAPLSSEFHQLYNSLFDNAEYHLQVVRALGEHRGGLTVDEIVKATDLTSGGYISKIINELKESGFIAMASEFGKKKKGARYRLIDEYSLFYLHWMEHSTPGTVSENYWQRMHGSPAYLAWSGYSFEAICFKHIKPILRALEISIVAESVSQWTHRSRKGESEGAQVDLVIDRADRCINLCEIKFSHGEFTIDKEYAKNLNERRERFRCITQTKKSLFNTLITTHGAKHNVHFLGTIDQEVTLDALFEEC